MDRYEGIAAGFYRKEYIHAEADQSRLNALVYLSNAGCDTPGYRPEYIEKIITAAKEHNLSKRYIDELNNYRETNA